MKKFASILVAMMLSLISVSAFAGGPCGANNLPVKVDGGWFISNDVIVAMGGDLGQEVGWRGDHNSWKYASARKGNHGGKDGYIFSGTGADYERWNPYQKGGGNGGWLRIEKAFTGYFADECSAIYAPDKVLSNGTNPDGTGPAFAMTQGSQSARSTQNTEPAPSGQPKKK